MATPVLEATVGEVRGESKFPQRIVLGTAPADLSLFLSKYLQLQERDVRYFAAVKESNSAVHSLGTEMEGEEGKKCCEEVSLQGEKRAVIFVTMVAVALGC